MSHHAIITSAVLALVCAGPAVAQAKKPASSLLITNARAVPTTDVTIRVGQGSVALTKPLAPGAKATLKLPKMTDCIVAVSAMFADESVVEVEAFDICREKTIRFTD